MSRWCETGPATKPYDQELVGNLYSIYWSIIKIINYKSKFQIIERGIKIHIYF